MYLDMIGVVVEGICVRTCTSECACVRVFYMKTGTCSVGCVPINKSGF